MGYTINKMVYGPGGAVIGVFLESDDGETRYMTVLEYSEMIQTKMTKDKNKDDKA